MDKWLRVYRGYFALMLLLLFKVLFCKAMLDMDKLDTFAGFCTTYPNRCKVVLTDLVSLTPS